MRINMCDGDSGAPVVRIVPLHEHWDLLEPCAELLNTQWQRSMGARLHGLRQSSNSYPVNLVLLQGEELIGHARLSRVLGSRSLLVESVVVQPGLRGRGYGRSLMEGVEHYAQGRGSTRLYLTTHDKQHFYAHLGFVPSRPVQNVGTLASFMPLELLHKFCRTSDSDGEETARSKTPPLSLAPPTMSSQPSVPPPPPPPPPPPTLQAPPPPFSQLSVPPPPPLQAPPLHTSQPPVPPPPRHQAPSPLSSQSYAPPPPPPPPPTIQAPPLFGSQPSAPPPPPLAPPLLFSQPSAPPPPPTLPAPSTPPFSSQPSAPPPAPPPPHSAPYSSQPSAPPPAPPPLPSSSWTPIDQTLDQTPYTDCRGLPIFWMHKDI
ncbi:N-alpha-acetyltransferase 80 isoform X2 [Astyanax mexicanus]|uniref:N-alpha-acetyltransferase 80 isoform X2 n=1 Tax=Astyanax mexicanus TaxID=7994 RepID=UPI0020CAC8CA|nr:N-alpha-acetyltransferase 80 isoform X2 [Astyanax mexicanus]